MTTLEEIYGYIPIHNTCYNIDPKMSVSKQGDDDSSEYFALTDKYFNVTGKQIHRFENPTDKDITVKCDLDENIVDIVVPANKNYTMFNCILTYQAQYRNTKQEDESTGIAPTEYTETARTTTSAKILVDENYEIVKTFPSSFSIPFKYAEVRKKNGEANATVLIFSQSTAKSSINNGEVQFFYGFKLGQNALSLEGKTSIINVLTDSDSKDELNQKIMDVADSLLNQINEEKGNITSGKIDLEPITNPDGSTENRWRWIGNQTLDKLIYTLQSQLDILGKNYGIGVDVLANLYGSLFPQVLSAAIQHDNAMISARTQVISALAQLTKTQQENVLAKVQSKWYYIQMQAFRANNDQKLFAAQYEGASTAFSSGMTDYQPRINTDEELLSLYGVVKSQFTGV